MAYVYGNALNVSLALIVFGLIQISMFVSCYFGCKSEFLFDFASPAWSGLFAILTGLFGICMVRSVREFKLGGLFLFLSLCSVLCSIACIAITAGFAFWSEYDLTMDNDNAAANANPGQNDENNDNDVEELEEEKGNSSIYLTGLAIEGGVILFALVLLICSCYAAWLNCCCEPRPPKGYLNGLETVYAADGTNENGQQNNNVVHVQAQV